MTIIATIRCLLGNCEKSSVLYEEFLKPDKDHRYTRLLRICECPHCHSTRATITSPEVDETRFSEPTHWMVNQVPEGAKP